MRNILHLGLVMTILLAVVNCGGNDNPPPDPPKPTITITVTPQPASIPAVGGAQTLTVATNATDWSVSSDASWLTATKINATSAKIEAAANSSANRNTVVRFSTGVATATATVNVSQGQVSAMQSDSLALVDLYNAAAGNSWTRRWTLTTPVNQWQGVTITSNRVTELKLSANNITGTLPESFGNLTALQYCDLSKNSLNDIVPASINRLTQLEYLDLSDNSLAGTCPAVNTLTKLLVFDISFNGFTALPALNSLTALEYLAFSKNNITGSLPDNLSALTKLIYLDASFNNFSGNIPSTWSSLNKMRVLYLYKNLLGGAIPAYITSFTALESLAFDGNNLTGNIPNDLGNLPKLAELWLSQNRLTGAIPNSLLNNSYWSAWQNDVCPQQSSFGFSNCSGTTSLPALQSAEIPCRAKEFKDRYRKN